jgi:hypothetical protein
VVTVEISNAIANVRRDIGDPAQMFTTQTISDGLTMLFDLPQQNVNPIALTVQYVLGSTTVPLLPTIVPGTQTTASFYGQSNFPLWSMSTTYSTGQLVSYVQSGLITYWQANNGSTGVTPGSNQTFWTGPLTVYTLDSVNGTLLFNTIIPLNATLIVTGTAWGMFTDNDLTDIVNDATRQHCMGQTLQERYKSTQGFITYRDVPKNLDNLPKMEENLIVTLADIDAMWILATDAATDVNVQTAEGTNIDRSARYQQLMEHIQRLKQKYIDWCAQLGVGMFRMETMTMRRISRTTNRYVPVFEGREYDDHRYPVRQLPQIDSRDQDTSGVPSPIWNGLPI